MGIRESMTTEPASVAWSRGRPRKSDSARRAPFARSLPKASKIARASALPAVPVYIHAQQEELSSYDRTYIRRKLGRRLGKFAGSIQRVSVRTEDVNGPRGGVDRVCRIKIVLRGLPSVIFEACDMSLDAAVDRALSGVERAVCRKVQRRRMKPLRSVV